MTPKAPPDRAPEPSIPRPDCHFPFSVAPYKIFNRQYGILEPLVSYRKQRTGTRSNRQKTPNRHFRLFALPHPILVPILFFVAALSLAASPLSAQSRRKVIIDQDCAGPGGTDMQALLVLINSPQTDVLGITVVTGDAWRDEEVAHTLRLLELIGRTDIPVLPGAVFPIVNSKEAVAEWEKKFGKVTYQGAWNFGNPVHGPWEIPPMPEGKPTTKASAEDAAHFLVRMVHKYPHQVTIYEGGPLTNLALAQTIDSHFASLARELVLMGGSIDPQTTDPEFRKNPHREFNLWMDPEASRCVLRAPWPRIVVTTVDISVKTSMDKALVAEIAKGTSPSAKYVAKYAPECNFQCYLWDELAAAAWLDSSIITKSKKMYLDVSLDRGATYGDTLAYDPGHEPPLHGPLAEVQEDLDRAKFYKEFVALMTAVSPHAH
ncbi:MAG TPA: nucleoside hydrolase [Candidatus Limnocylindrales bacterium]|nr:nucleoside hydrolase [Candidatus Limnocylindrales bacterium]